MACIPPPRPPERGGGIARQRHRMPCSSLMTSQNFAPRVPSQSKHFLIPDNKKPSSAPRARPCEGCAKTGQWTPAQGRGVKPGSQPRAGGRAGGRTGGRSHPRRRCRRERRMKRRRGGKRERGGGGTRRGTRDDDGGDDDERVEEDRGNKGDDE